MGFALKAKLSAGPGLAGGLGDECVRNGWQRPFVVTDRGVEATSGFARVVEGLGRGATVAGIYAGVLPDTGVDIVAEGADLARAAGSDCLVAVGGGSVIDTAKGMAAVLTLGQSLLELEGYNTIDRPLLPVIAVPTTAGSGSEVTTMAVIRDRERGVKLSYVSPYLTPDLAILDPELTLSLSPWLTTCTAMDALSHAVEAYLSTEANPYTDALALAAVGMIVPTLPVALRRSDDLEARYRLLVASSMAGMAFGVALVGCVHAMAHALGGVLKVPHGLANAILLPYGMAYNLPVREQRLRDLARAAGVDDIIAAARTLGTSTGIPASLKAAGVPWDRLDEVAELAVLDGAIYTNPREAAAADLLNLLQQAYEGRN